VAGDQDAQITVRIPSSIRRRLDALAAKERRKSSDLIRFALQEYVARETIGLSGNPEKAFLIEWVSRLKTVHPDLFRAFLSLSEGAEDPAVYAALIALGSLTDRALGPKRG
jgi:Arc/MetJ-type ribon-helix-helix transcriptional regulator